MTREQEWDYLILRSCCQVLNVHPDDDVCPDIEAIANGNGTVMEKVDRLGAELETNVRARRQPA